MKKLEAIADTIEGQETTIGYAFFCPGCKQYHLIHVKPYKNPMGASWEFNGDVEKPTFSPSILRQTELIRRKFICHLYIRDGKIQYLGDCSHELKGQTVELPNI